MKIVTRKELLNMKGDFAYAEHDKGDLPENVRIKYSSDRDVKLNNGMKVEGVDSDAEVSFSVECAQRIYLTHEDLVNMLAMYNEVIEK